MTQIQPFDFDGTAVRVVTIDGEPWFVLADLLHILGVGRKPAAVIHRLDADGVRQADPMPDTLGRPQTPLIVNEPNLWLVILRSDSPAAEPVRRWVTHEVLPTIRRTGQYGTAPAALTEDQIVAQALQITTAKVKQLEAKVATDAPKVAYVDTYVADEDLLKLRTVAADLGVGEEELRRILMDRKWIYAERSTRWSNSKGRKEPVTRYSAFADKKPYFRPVPRHEAPRFKGEAMHTLKVTPAGASAIARNLPRWLAGDGEVAA